MKDNSWTLTFTSIDILLLFFPLYVSSNSDPPDLNGGLELLTLLTLIKREYFRKTDKLTKSVPYVTLALI